MNTWIGMFCICPLPHFIVILYIITAGMFFTSMLMRMFRWVHGLLVLMWNISMTGGYVVALHLVKL